MAFDLPPLQPAGSACIYATMQDLVDNFGRDNVSAWSAMDAQADPDEANIQRALDYAAGEIDNFFRGGPYAVPLVLASGESTVRHWAVVIAGERLYHNRGQLDKGEGPFSTDLALVRAEMRQYRSGMNLRLDAQLASVNATNVPAVFVDSRPCRGGLFGPIGIFWG